MPYSEVLGYLVLFSGVLLLGWRKTFSALFVFICLASWEVKDFALGLMEITSSPQIAVIGMLVDLALIIVITGFDLKSKIVLPALFFNMAYAVACLVEYRLGISEVIQLGYGWVTALVGLTIIIGGFFNDPGGYRDFDSVRRSRGVRSRLLADTAMDDKAA